MLADHQPRPAAHDAGRFGQDHLKEAGILPRLGRQRDGPGRGSDRCQVHGPALRLGDDLLRDDDDVAGLRNDGIRREKRSDKRRQIVARPDHRQTLGGQKLECGRCH